MDLEYSKYTIVAHSRSYPELQQAWLWTPGRKDLASSLEVELAEIALDVGLGAGTRMKRIFDACLLKHVSSSFSDLNPFFIRCAVTPLMEK